MITLKKILKDCFSMKESEFTDAQSIIQLEDFDSMNHMMFITQFEEAYGIEITGDEIASMVTIGDIKQLLVIKNIETEV
jgi:acyl carrier protein